MASDTSFRDFVLDQLSGMDELICRRMFGGFGLYRAEAFFGIIHNGGLYLRTDDETRPVYESHGMGPFQPNERQTLKNYYEVPLDILEDAPQLTAWAERAASR